MTSELRIRLEDMLTFAEGAVSLVERLGESGIRAEWGLRLGLIKAVETIGEAASKIPKDERPVIGGVPWRQVVGLRHHLVHGYGQVRLAAIFDVVRDELPALIAGLKAFLETSPP